MQAVPELHHDDAGITSQVLGNTGLTPRTAGVTYRIYVMKGGSALFEEETRTHETLRCRNGTYNSFIECSNGYISVKQTLWSITITKHPPLNINRAALVTCLGYSNTDESNDESAKIAFQAAKVLLGKSDKIVFSLFSFRFPFIQPYSAEIKDFLKTHVGPCKLRWDRMRERAQRKEQW